MRQPELALPRVPVRRSRRDGTALLEMQPCAIISAAQEDLRRRARNIHHPVEPVTIEVYTFHRMHVRRAKTAADLIRIAIAGRRLGLKSTKAPTRFIYRDRKALKRALREVT